MRVTHVIVGLGDGGAEKSLYKLIRADSTNQHSVISLTDDGKYGPKLRDLGVRVESLGLRPLRLVGAIRGFYRFIKKQESEVLHGWMPHACLAVSAVAPFIPSTRIYWSIRATDYGRGFQSYATRLAVRSLARVSRQVPRKIFVVGQRAMDAHSKLGFDRGKMVVVPNGYEVRPHNSLSSRRAKSQTERAATVPFTIGMVARYHPQKDHLNLLEALAIVLKTRKDFSVTLAGEGVTDRNGELTGHVLRLGLTGHVNLAGPVEDPAYVYEKLDLHILSSAFGEGFPNVVAESMLAGVPNIVSDVGDAAEIVGDTGWVVAPQSPSQLATAILRAMGERSSQLASRGERARKRISSSYSLKKMVDGHNANYNAKSLVVFPRYDNLGASSRVRMLQFYPYLEGKGWEVSSFPFASNRYVTELYSGNRRIFQVLVSYFRRLRSLSKISQADLVWVEKELIPWAPYFLEKLLVSSHVPTVLDFDDAVHEQFRRHRRFLVRAFLGGKIRKTASRADAVVVGNDYLEDYFREFARGRTHLVPSVIDEKKSHPLPESAGGLPRKFIFGWIGTRITWDAYVARLLGMFEALAKELDGEFWVIGAGSSRESSETTKYFDWSEENENELLNSLDVGIMPLEDDPWSRGKCGFKLLQCMAVGIPVIASSVGVNTQIVSHGQNGYLVQSDEEWGIYLRELAFQRAKIDAMGAAALATVKGGFTFRLAAPKTNSILTAVLKSRRSA